MNEHWTGIADFVSRPRTVDDLMNEKNTRFEQINYEVTTIVNLDLIDYENFITDMTVSRDYLEDVPGNREEKKKVKCLLVMGRGLFFSEERREKSEELRCFAEQNIIKQALPKGGACYLSNYNVNYKRSLP